jgi:hypothetical protein
MLKACFGTWFEVYLGCFDTCLGHIFGTWFETYHICFGTCLRHIFGTWFEEYHECFGTWIIAYLGDVGHMFWDMLFVILA